MDNQLKKNRLTILLIFAISIVPFGIAWFLAEHPEKVKLGTNHGILITPPLPTELSDFSGYDQFSAENIGELKGHWILLNPITEAECGPVCAEGLYKTQQLTLMMGKDISRIRRLAVLFDQTAHVLPKQWQEDARLLKAVPSVSLKQMLNQIIDLKPGYLIIMDPLGNLMMKYEPGYDPYKVKSDLSKLLRISQIG